MHQAPPGQSRQGQLPRSKRSVYNWIRLVAAATLVGLCITLALQRIGPPPQRPHRLQMLCGANLNGISKGIAIYAVENEGAFPPDLQALVEIEVVPPRMLQCPGRSAPSSCDYFYLPPEALMTFGDDGAETRPAARPDALMLCDLEGNHGDGRNVAFVGGNVKWLTEEEFQAELAKPVNAAFAAALGKAEAGAVDSRPASATSAPSTRPS